MKDLWEFPWIPRKDSWESGYALSRNSNFITIPSTSSAGLPNLVLLKSPNSFPTMFALAVPILKTQPSDAIYSSTIGTPRCACMHSNQTPTSLHSRWTLTDHSLSRTYPWVISLKESSTTMAIWSPNQPSKLFHLSCNTEGTLPGWGSWLKQVIHRDLNLVPHRPDLHPPGWRQPPLLPHWSGTGESEGQPQQFLVWATFSSFFVWATSKSLSFQKYFFKCPILEDKNIF